MKQDYKAIADIIKSRRHPRNTMVSDNIAMDLADHFEREDKCKDCGLSKGNHHIATVCPKHYADFNKKQFLKDCGVE